MFSITRRVTCISFSLHSNTWPHQKINLKAACNSRGVFACEVITPKLVVPENQSRTTVLGHAPQHPTEVRIFP
jgi:hypothetical protein